MTDQLVGCMDVREGRSLQASANHLNSNLKEKRFIQGGFTTSKSKAAYFYKTIFVGYCCYCNKICKRRSLCKGLLMPI
jgi:hypothetical protein